MKRKKRRMRNRFMIGICFILFVGFFTIKLGTVSASADVPDRYKYYTSIYVDRDDTLWEISQDYMSEEYTDIRDYIAEVKAINHLTADELQYGTTICIPYYSDELK